MIFRTLVWQCAPEESGTERERERESPRRGARGGVSNVATVCEREAEGVDPIDRQPRERAQLVTIPHCDRIIGYNITARPA